MLHPCLCPLQPCTRHVRPQHRQWCIQDATNSASGKHHLSFHTFSHLNNFLLRCNMLHMDSGMSLSALWHLDWLLYGYGTVLNAGYHSWNPLTILLSLCVPLMEDYKYDRLSSVLILET